MKSERNKIAWVVRAGKNASANSLFFDQSLVALEDANMGDLSNLPPRRDSFCDKYRQLHPDDTQTGSSGIAGKFFRFTVEMSDGDIVLYPCLIDKCVYIGRLQGNYKYLVDSDFPHRRKVKWQWFIHKSMLSVQAQFELGAARTFFSFKKNFEEVERLISSGKLNKYKKSEAPRKNKVSR